MITRTMLLIAVRQHNWIEVAAMSAELAGDNTDEKMNAVKNAAERAVKDEKEAQVLLELWAQIKWFEINDE